MALQRKDASQLDGDQPGRRKPFVIVASVLMAISMAIPLISPTLIALFIQTVLAALAFGIDGHVDQALFIDVLPDENAAGRDLGVANIATNLGQALGPIIAAKVAGRAGHPRQRRRTVVHDSIDNQEGELLCIHTISLRRRT